MIILFVIFVILMYIYYTCNYSYWQKRNVKHDRPLPLFGNHFQSFFGIKNITTSASDLYNKYSEELVVGYYRGSTPELVIRDLDIIRHILNVDFSYFHPRGIGSDNKKDKLLSNVFHVDGDSWKLLRKNLTPAFTTAKLKNMFPLIIKCAKSLKSAAEKKVSSSDDCDVRDLMARFSTDLVSVCGFGLDIDTLNDENSLLRRIGKKIFERSFNDVILNGVRDISPQYRSMTRLLDKKVENAISNMTMQILQKRNFKPIGRNDFVDLLLDSSSKSIIEGESVEHRNEDGSPKRVQMEMDLDCLIAQIFIFFAAGFETSSSAMSYTLHELAFKPDYQNKIQAEIDNILTRYDNELCYDAIAEMSFLDMALKEGMRKMPPVGNLTRVCARQYTLPKLGVTIDPGVRIIVPIQAIHTDTKYYDNPDEFIPERFGHEENKRIPKYAYLPFGDGPRACLGSRLGQMQSLAGLATILQRFNIEPSKKTKRCLVKNHRLNIIQGVIDGIPLKLKLRVTTGERDLIPKFNQGSKVNV